MEVRTTNFFLEDYILCLHDYTPLETESFNELYMGLPFFDGGDLDGFQTGQGEYKGERGKRKLSFTDWIDFAPRQASHNLLFIILANSFEESFIKDSSPQEMDEATVNSCICAPAVWLWISRIDRYTSFDG